MHLTSQERRVLIVLEDAERSLSADEIVRKIRAGFPAWVHRTLETMPSNWIEVVTVAGHTRYTITTVGRRALMGDL